jgi:DNA polymerase III epsilon subunit-like protein
MVMSKGMESNILYIDVETNGVGGFRPPTQRVMQISWIHCENEYNYFVHGVESVADGVPHSITVEYCKEYGEQWDVIYKELERCLEDADKIVCHNADFDVSTVAHELKIRNSKSYQKFKRLVKDFLSTGSIVCTMKMTVDICKIQFKTRSGYKYPKLEELYKHLFGSVPKGLHDSLEDCRVTKECYERLYK